MAKPSGPDRGFVSGDGELTFLNKKSERATSALYLVTNLLPVSEPLRTHLRECGLTILSEVLSLIKGGVTSPSVWARSVAGLSSQIEALLSVARVAGAISEMNASLLMREYAAIGEIATAHADAQRAPLGHVQLSEDFFAIALPLQTEPTRPAALASSDRFSQLNPVSRTSIASNTQVSVRAASRGASEEPRTAFMGRQSGKVADKKTDRRDRIILLLKKQGHISVKDATEAISGCSEKTLQRELLALVAEGVVAKTGERRWSTYSLAST